MVTWVKAVEPENYTLPPVGEGMMVIDADAAPVGRVTMIRSEDFGVERDGRDDVYVPLGRVQKVFDGEIVLDVSTRQIDAMDWSR